MGTQVYELPKPQTDSSGLPSGGGDAGEEAEGGRRRGSRLSEEQSHLILVSSPVPRDGKLALLD